MNLGLTEYILIITVIVFIIVVVAVIRNILKDIEHEKNKFSLNNHDWDLIRHQLAATDFCRKCGKLCKKDTMKRIKEVGMWGRYDTYYCKEHTPAYDELNWEMGKTRFFKKVEVDKNGTPLSCNEKKQETRGRPKKNK